MLYVYCLRHCFSVESEIGIMRPSTPLALHTQYKYIQLESKLCGMYEAVDLVRSEVMGYTFVSSFE